MFAEDAADDEEAEAGAGGFGGGVGFEEGAEFFRGDAGAGVGDADEDFVGVGRGGDGDGAAGCGDGLVGVFEEVEEGLFDLGGVEGEAGGGSLRV